MRGAGGDYTIIHPRPGAGPAGAPRRCPRPGPGLSSTPIRSPGSHREMLMSAAPRWLLAPVLFGLALPARADDPPAEAGPPPRALLTAQQDHRLMMDRLKIKELRPGANPNNPKAPNAVNYDEAKANPYPRLPDPLVCQDGTKVTTAEQWWKKRRPEIVEDFDREVYGRVPRDVPKVTWEVTATEKQTVGDIPAVTKRLVGHVDNSACPAIKVDIQLTLTTPEKAAGPVPVIMEFGFVFGGKGGFKGKGGPTWQEQVLAKGWGYAIIVPNSIQADTGGRLGKDGNYQGLTTGIIGLCNRGQPR